MPSITGVSVLGALFIAYVVFRATRARKSVQNLPPSPPADPIIGHLRIFAGKQEEEFYNLNKKYGDVVYLNVLGKHFVILSSEEAAKDLLDKRGGTYGSRPPCYWFDNIGFKDTLFNLPYGENFLRQRRIVQQPVLNHKVMDFKEIMEREVDGLLIKLLDSPKGFIKHINFMTSAITADVAYGHRITSEDDEYLKIIEDFTELVKDTIRASMLDLLPFVQHLPEAMQAWFNIPSLKSAQRVLAHIMDYPMEEVQKRMTAGKAGPSFASLHLESLSTDKKESSATYEEIRVSAQQIYGAGSETTWTTLNVFVLAMLLHPEAQKKAQAEIDRVVGSGRLPEFSDRESLPFVDAVLHETMRWHSVNPSGVAHYSVADDEYRGMFIPKGSIIIPNTRSMALDENKYHEPFTYKPERFLPSPEGHGEIFSTNIAFGFGRRKCPGQYLADSVAWLTIARLLATFNISPAKDEAGRPIEAQPKFHFTGIVSDVADVLLKFSHPEPYECEIVPRSPKTEALARAA